MIVCGLERERNKEEIASWQNCLTWEHSSLPFRGPSSANSLDNQIGAFTNFIWWETPDDLRSIPFILGWFHTEFNSWWNDIINGKPGRPVKSPGDDADKHAVLCCSVCFDGFKKRLNARHQLSSVYGLVSLFGQPHLVFTPCFCVLSVLLALCICLMCYQCLFLDHNADSSADHCGCTWFELDQLRHARLGVLFIFLS